MEMMKIEDLVNDIILIVLKKVGDLSAAGINQRKFYAKIIGYDEFGIWVDLPNYEIVISEDESGNPLQPDQVTREKINASVLIMWSHIVTLVHFPNRENFDFPSPFDINIGFNTTQSDNDDSD